MKGGAPLSTAVKTSAGVTRPTRARGTFWNTLVVIVVVILAAMIALPFLWMISTSLKADLASVYRYPPEWFSKPLAWGNYIKAWNAAAFDRYLFNSIFVTSTIMILQVFNACLCAYAFSRIEFRGQNLLFALFLAVMMVPVQVTVVPVYIIFSRLELLNTYWALILPFASSAFGIFLIRQAFLSVPIELSDAAFVDGATHFQILRHIMIPLSKPMIITFTVLNFSWRWNDYFWTLIMTNSDTMRTLPVGIVAMRAGQEGGANWHTVMAASVIVLVPIFLIFLLAQRYFIEGIARSGIKA